MKRVFVTALFLAMPPLVSAHALLVEANPPKDATLTKPPIEVVLRFDDQVGERYLGLAVIDLDRKRRVDNKDVHRDASDPSIVRATLKSPLLPGRYLVRYRVQSADTHIITGQYAFRILPSGAVRPAQVEPSKTATESWSSRLYRWFSRLFGLL